MLEQSLGAAAGEIFNPRTVWPPVCRLLYAGEVDVLDLLRDSMRRNKQPRNKAMTMIRFVVTRGREHLLRVKAGPTPVRATKRNVNAPRPGGKSVLSAVSMFRQLTGRSPRSPESQIRGLLPPV